MPESIRAANERLRSRPRRGGFLAALVFASLSSLLSTPVRAETRLGVTVMGAVHRALTTLREQEITALTLVLALLGVALLTIVVLFRARRSADRAEIDARDEAAALRADVDRLNALLLSEPQILVTWPAASEQPEIIGDTTMLAPGGARERVLAFGTWLDASAARRMEAFLIEAELLLDWYLPKLGVKINDIKRNAFRSHWQALLLPLTSGPQTWVLRDLHSPNLLWLPEREGASRVGLLDFQDAVMGPAAYDLASLLQDARVDVPEMMEIALLSRYVRARMRKGSFEASDFAHGYATLAAQRASKILGIFARLERRDHKPQYLRHVPRVWNYLQRSLAHPALAPLAAWYRANVPALRV